MPKPVLELEQLKLRYPGCDSWTLDGLDLQLQAGEKLALVGSSGCGKSTVARAVLQLLPLAASAVAGCASPVPIHAIWIDPPCGGCAAKPPVLCFKTR